MTRDHADIETTGFSCERSLGEYDTGSEGPTLMVVGGLHGNEPSGVRALHRIFADLAATQPELRGRIVGLAGNRLALERAVRYVEEDLNRIWGKPAGESPSHEYSERDALLEALDAESRVGHHVIVLDLHATSAQGAPFCIMADTLQNRELAFALPIPVILGLEETISGTLLEWASEQGHTALCVEGGQRSSAESIDHHEATVWLTLVAAGMLDANNVPDLEQRRGRLSEECQRLPEVLEVIHRHKIDPDDGFAMDPGFINFEIVAADQKLARRGSGDVIRAPIGSRILMPLYQAQGNDGFFLVRRVRKFWLRLSSVMRRLGLDAIVHWLPGVARDPDNGGVLQVNRHVARIKAIEIFHLLGYRIMAADETHLTLRRRLERSQQ